MPKIGICDVHGGINIWKARVSVIPMESRFPEKGSNCPRDPAVGVRGNHV